MTLDLESLPTGKEGSFRALNSRRTVWKAKYFYGTIFSFWYKWHHHRWFHQCSNRLHKTAAIFVLSAMHIKHSTILLIKLFKLFVNQLGCLDADFRSSGGVFMIFIYIEWDTPWRCWLRHCAISRKVASPISEGVIGIFHWHNPSGRTMTLGSTLPLTEMSTRNISWRVKKTDA